IGPANYLPGPRFIFLQNVRAPRIGVAQRFDLGGVERRRPDRARAELAEGLRAELGIQKEDQVSVGQFGVAAGTVLFMLADKQGQYVLVTGLHTPARLGAVQAEPGKGAGCWF